MIIDLCIKFQSNTLILSKDIARKPKVLRTGRTGRTDERTDSGDTIYSPLPPLPPPPPHPPPTPIENGKMAGEHNNMRLRSKLYVIKVI